MHILKEMNFFIKKVKNIFYFDSCSYCDMFTIMLGYCKKNKVCYNFNKHIICFLIGKRDCFTGN